MLCRQQRPKANHCRSFPPPPLRRLLRPRTLAPSVPVTLPVAPDPQGGEAPITPPRRSKTNVAFVRSRQRVPAQVHAPQDSQNLDTETITQKNKNNTPGHESSGEESDAHVTRSRNEMSSTQTALLSVETIRVQENLPPDRQEHEIQADPPSNKAIGVQTDRFSAEEDNVRVGPPAGGDHSVHTDLPSNREDDVPANPPSGMEDGVQTDPLQGVDVHDTQTDPLPGVENGVRTRNQSIGEDCSINIHLSSESYTQDEIYNSGDLRSSLFYDDEENLPKAATVNALDTPVIVQAEGSHADREPQGPSMSEFVSGLALRSRRAQEEEDEQTDSLPNERVPRSVVQDSAVQTDSLPNERVPRSFSRSVGVQAEPGGTEAQVILDMQAGRNGTAAQVILETFTKALVQTSTEMSNERYNNSTTSTKDHDPSTMYKRTMLKLPKVKYPIDHKEQGSQTETEATQNRPLLQTPSVEEHPDVGSFLMGYAGASPEGNVRQNKSSMQNIMDMAETAGKWISSLLPPGAESKEVRNVPGSSNQPIKFPLSLHQTRNKEAFLVGRYCAFAETGIVVRMGASSSTTTINKSNKAVISTITCYQAFIVSFHMDEVSHMSEKIKRIANTMETYKNDMPSGETRESMEILYKYNRSLSDILKRCSESIDNRKNSDSNNGLQKRGHFPSEISIYKEENDFS